MSRSSIQEIEGLLALAGDLPVEAELAVEKLLNVVEALSSDRQSRVAHPVFGWVAQRQEASDSVSHDQQPPAT